MRSILLSSVAFTHAIAFMSEIVDTVTVKGEDGKALRINASDYDEKKHGKPYTGKDAEVANQPPMMATSVTNFTGEPAPSPAAPTINDPNAGNPHPAANSPLTSEPQANGTDGDRPVALQPPQEPATAIQPGQQWNVAKIGSKHFVVDPTGNKVEADGIEGGGYKTAGDAWGAIGEALAKPAAPTQAAPQEGQQPTE